MNYQIMNAPAADGSYYPDYEALISGASCEEEAEYLKEIQARGYGFAYNMVYCHRQACGHFEIFQHHVRSKAEAMAWFGIVDRELADRKCTQCICGWRRADHV